MIDVKSISTHCTRTEFVGTTVLDTIGLVISGIDAGPYMNSFADQLSVLYNINLEVRPVVNHFFGETITVTGLLTGQDIIRAFEEDKADGKMPPDVILLPDCTLKADEDIFLDDMTLEDLKDRLKLPVLVSPASGEGYLKTLDEYTGIFDKSGQRRSPIRGKKINE